MSPIVLNIVTPMLFSSGPGESSLPGTARSILFSSGNLVVMVLMADYRHCRDMITHKTDLQISRQKS